MAFFIFLTLKYILEGVLDSVKSLTGIISMLEDRARVMNNDIVITNKDVVACDDGHPISYIHTDRTGKVVYCQYCNKGFRFQNV